MTDPIEYRILQNIQASLLAIAVSAGYHFDMPARAVKLDPNHSVEELIAPEGPRPFVYIEPKSEGWQYISMPNGVQIDWPVTIHWIHDTDPTDDNSRVQRFFQGCADIERAVTRDLSRGGLAVDTKVSQRVYLPHDRTEVWAQVDLTIRVRRLYGGPNGEAS